MRHAAWLLCAWVLWSPIMNERGEAISERFSVGAAYDSKADCEAAWRKYDAAIRKPGQPPTGMICLPDTVDPRGPKR